MIPFSVLDLAPICEGGSAAQSFRNSVDLAQHAERWGYRRYWLAEHHNMPGIASSATSLVIGHVAAATSTIRVGAGGIMLPNHSPLVIAEQFGTLGTLYPGRIDLGLGRAPGSDQQTARAMRRDLMSSSESFPDNVVELMAYFRPDATQEMVQAVPAAGVEIEPWILGSSLFGAQLAAALGLPYAFASHFAPGDMMKAVELYRATFRPSERLAKPYVMLGVNVFAADTEEEAQLARSSQLQAFIQLRRGRPTRVPPPVKDFEHRLLPQERFMLAQTLAISAVGTPEVVREGLKSLIERTGADELILASMTYDHAARLRSYEIAAQVREELARGG